MGFFSGGGGGFVSAVTNVVQKAAAPVVSVAQKTKDFVATPTGSAMLPMAAVFSPTGRSNLAGFAQQLAPMAGAAIGGPAGANIASAGAGLANDYFGQEIPQGSGFFSSPTAPYQGGGGGGGSYYSPTQSGGLPSWVLPVGIGVVVLGFVAIMITRK